MENNFQNCSKDTENMSILYLIIYLNISKKILREFIYQQPVINRLPFLILISSRTFILVHVSFKLVGLLSLSASKRWLGLDVSDFYLQSSLCAQLETRVFRQRQRLSVLFPISIKIFSI